MAKVHELYDYLKGYGALSDSVTVEQFSKEMQNKGRREQLHGYMQQNGFLTKEADFVSFDNALGSRDMTFGENVQHIGKTIGNTMQAAGKAFAEGGERTAEGLFGAVGRVLPGEDPFERMAEASKAERAAQATLPNGGQTYRPVNTFEGAGQKIMSGDVLGGIGEGIGATIETGAGSLAGMATTATPVVGVAAFGVSQMQQFAEERAKNSGRDKPDAMDYVVAAPAAVVSAALERIGIGGLNAAPMRKYVTDSLQRRLGVNAVNTLAKTAIEGGTEAQQQIVQYAAEILGTQKDFDLGEAGRQALVAAAGGAGVGGMIGGPVSVMQKLETVRTDVGGREIAQAIDQLVNQADLQTQERLMGIGQPQPQVRQAPAPRESMAEKLAKRGVVIGRNLYGSIEQQESSGNRNAYNPLSKATGPVQITPIFLKEGNRLLGTNYSLQEMTDPKKSEQIANAVHGLWIRQFQRRNGRLPDAAEMAMMHHGGPEGYLRPNAKDAHGISNAEYTRQVVSRMGQPGGVPQSVQPETQPQGEPAQSATLPDMPQESQQQAQEEATRSEPIIQSPTASERLETDFVEPQPIANEQAAIQEQAQEAKPAEAAQSGLPTQPQGEVRTEVKSNKRATIEDDDLWDTSTSESFKSLPGYAQQAIFEHHMEGVTNERVHRGLITADWVKETVPVESMKEKNGFHFDSEKQKEYADRKIYNSGPAVLDYNGELIDGNHRFNKAVREGDKTIDVYKPVVKESLTAQPDVTQQIKRAEQEVDTTPTDAQIEAGNYKKGHVKVNGFDITIENPKGSVRSGTDKGGREWSQTMQNTYGYFKRTEGKDGDHVDVFLSDNPETGKVFVIDQVVDGKFDEHKVMMGFPDAESAKDAYHSNYEKGWKGFGGMAEMTPDEFRMWLEKGIQKKPVASSRTEPTTMSLDELYTLRDNLKKGLAEYEKKGLPADARKEETLRSVNEAIRALEAEKGNEDFSAVKDNPVSLTKEKQEPKTEVTDGTTERLGDTGKEPLEGVPSDEVQGAEGSRDAGRGGTGSRTSDREGNGRADGGRVSGTRSVGDGEGAVSVPAGRGEPSEKVGRGTGGKSVRGDVQSGDADTKRDTANRDRSGDRGGAAANRGDGRQVEAQEKAAEESRPPVTTNRSAVKASEVPAEMFTITDAVRIGEGGAKTKFNNNIAAIRLLKKLEAEGRPATRDEQEILALYVGWGGIPQAFYKPDGSVTKGWDDAARELKAALTDSEYEAARRSTQDAHYTSRSVVNGIWAAVRGFGFTGGRVLEPSVGTGNFLGLMPVDLRNGSQITAVELDTITGAVAKHLYPGANIHAPMGFQDAQFSDNRYDVAIGNPPFGDQKLYDKKRKHLNKFSIHNYFFAKSVDALRPNGVLAMVVSSRLMDSGKDQARKYIADRTEFLGAIRLPNNAFLKNAGTEVTTDILFLRKLADSEAPADNRPWLETVMVKDKKGIEIPLNRYFADNPDMMLGEWGAFGSMYGPNEPALVAREGQDTEKLLADAIEKLPKNIMGAPGAPVTRETVAKPTESFDMPEVKEQSMFVRDGKVYRKVFDPGSLKHVAEPVEFANKKAEERVSGMVAVRDAFAALRAAQLDESVGDKQLEFIRQKLNVVYDRFVKEHGPINSQANKLLFRQDPTWPQVSALEEGFDKGISPAVAKTTGEKARRPSAKKAAIFFKRTQSPYKPVTTAATAKDALSASLSEYGRIDFERMRDLYGKSQAEMVNELGPLVFEDPVSGWVTRDEYLSGNVKRKLAQARDAAKQDSRFDRNVEELKEVIPTDVEAVDIVVRIGGHWIPPSDMSDFAAHLTGNPRAKASYDAISAKWSFSGSHPTDAAQAEFGTSRKYADAILDAVANGKAITVYDKDADGKSFVNKAETAAANDKAERIKERFASWVWQSDERRERLVKLYNDTFNTDRQREYDGSHLSFPGKVSDDIVKLRPHQANAVWRCLQGGTTLLGHVVGAGKTFTMIATAMEMRRMGRAKKPVFVVPNHLVGQWAADFVKLYPGANILAATKQDFESQNRKRFFSRIATGDWDAVIVAHSSFKLLASSPEFEREFIEMQIRDIEISIENLREADGKDSRSVKQQEKQRDKLRSKLARLLDSGSKDDNLNFAELGIDALFVDEAHEFKNLSFSTSMTRVGGLNPAGSQRAADMFSKTMFVQRLTGGRNVVFATGTPISNTMAEMYTMQRYLQYKTMQDQGVAHFDAWARMYGEVVSDWELSPAGKYVMRSRFSRFVNIPELMQQYLSFADVISREDINRQLAAQGKRLPVPEMVSGKPVNVVVERSADQADYIGEPTKDANGNDVYPAHSLVYRSENLPKRPGKGEDNMLVIMGLARKAALDMRLIDPAYPDDPGSKVNEAARRIKEQYDQWDHVKGAQLVFCDLSTPAKARGKEAARIGDLLRRADDGDEEAIAELDKIDPDELAALESKFSVYDDLKAKLITMGIKEGEVAFIHDANTEQQKEDLFGKVRSGRVRVLMGSTQKMGAGMNVQERLVALHHLDAPWRPSDLEQREGRIIRQGNVLYDADPEGFRVFVGRYATKNTLDSRMWQTIETKARFIEQIKKGGTSERVIEDIGGEAANAAEMKAASSGNPLILEEMTLRQKVQKLNQQKTNHDREQHRIKDSIRIKKKALVRMDGELPDMKADAETAAQIGQEFAIQVGKKVFDKRQEAGEALVATAKKIGSAKPVSIGSIGGFSITVHTNDLGHNKLSVSGKNLYTPKSDVDLSSDDLSKEQKGGIATQIFNVARTVPGKEFDATRSEIKRIETDIPALEKQIRAWEHEKELVEVKLRHAAVIRELQPKSEQKPQAGDAGDDISAMASLDPMPGWVPFLSAAGFPERPESGKVKIGSRTVELPPEDKPVRIEQIRLMAEQLIGRGLYFGKVKMKAEGFHRKSIGEVRMANYNDAEVLAHEISHFLGDSGGKDNPLHKLYTDRRFAAELKNLSYTSADGKTLREGFAEYMRLWFTQYDQAKQAAPKFTEAFDKFLADDKRTMKAMAWLQDAMHQWVNQGDAARLEAVTSGNQFTPMQRLTMWIAQRPLSLMRQQYVDNLHAAKLMGADIYGGQMRAEDDPYKQLQLINGVEGIVQESFIHGAPVVADDGSIKFEGPSLEQVWKTSLQKGMKVLRDQEKYFVARRAAELKMQGRERLLSVGMIKEGLALAEKYPWFKKSFSDYQKYRENLLAFMVDCGYVEERAAKKFMEVNRNYVPFNREVEGIGQSFAGGGNLKRLKGGTQNLKHVYDNILLGDAQHIKVALRARAMRELYSTALKHEEGGKWIAPLGKDSRLVKTNVEQQAKAIAEAMAALGMTVADGGRILSGDPMAETITDVEDIQQVLLDDPELMQFWTFGHKPSTVETGVDSFIDPNTGVRRWVEIQRDNELLLDMVNGLAGMRHPDGLLGVAFRMATAVKQFQTMTITAAWQFAGPNIVRDMQQAFVLSGGKFRPLVDNVYGIAAILHDLVKREGWYHEMKAQGGGWSGRVRSIMTDTWAMERGAMAPKTRSKYHPVRVAQELLDVLMSVADTAEMSTRVGFYIRMRKAGAGAREAAWQAREISTDFRKHGSYAPFVLLQRTVPFLGAFIQGADRDIRALAEMGGRMSVKNVFRVNRAKAGIYAAGGAMIATAMLIALMNDDDDRYEDLTPDQKTRFFHFFVGDNHFTIPKPHGFFSLMAAAGEAVVDTMKGQAGEDAGKFMAFAVAYQLGADIMPGFANPLYELAVNKSFTGAPIIGERLQGLSPELQFTDRTPGLYIAIGQKLGVAPDAVHHLVRGYTGYVSDFLNEATERALWNREQWGERPFQKGAGEFIGKQFVQKQVPYRTKWTEKYYDLRRRAAEKAASLSRLQKAPALRDREMLERFAGDDASMRLAAANKAFRQIDKAFADQEMMIASIKYDPYLPAEEKERRIDAYYEQKNGLLKEAYRQIEAALK